MSKTEMTNKAFGELYDALIDEIADDTLLTELERLLRDQGSALQSARLRIEQQEAELDAARAELARVRELPERWRAGFRLLSDAQTCARDLDAALTTPPAPVS